MSTFRIFTEGHVSILTQIFNVIWVQRGCWLRLANHLFVCKVILIKLNSAGRERHHSVAHLLDLHEMCQSKVGDTKHKRDQNSF